MPPAKFVILAKSLKAIAEFLIGCLSNTNDAHPLIPQFAPMAKLMLSSFQLYHAPCLLEVLDSMNKITEASDLPLVQQNLFDITGIVYSITNGCVEPQTSHIDLVTSYFKFLKRVSLSKPYILNRTKIVSAY